MDRSVSRHKSGWTSNHGFNVAHCIHWSSNQFFGCSIWVPALKSESLLVAAWPRFPGCGPWWGAMKSTWWNGPRLWLGLITTAILAKVTGARIFRPPQGHLPHEFTTPQVLTVRIATHSPTPTKHDLVVENPKIITSSQSGPQTVSKGLQSKIQSKWRQTPTDWLTDWLTFGEKPSSGRFLRRNFLFNLFVRDWNDKADQRNYSQGSGKKKDILINDPSGLFCPSFVFDLFFTLKFERWWRSAMRGVVCAPSTRGAKGTLLMDFSFNGQYFFSKKWRRHGICRPLENNWASTLLPFFLSGCRKWIGALGFKGNNKYQG